MIYSNQNDEQEHKLKNIQEMCDVVENKVDELLLQEKAFYKQRKYDTLKTPPYVEVPRIHRDDEEDSDKVDDELVD